MEIIFIVLAATAIAVVLILLFIHLNRGRYAKMNEKYSEFEKRRSSALWATARVIGIRGGAAGETSEKARMNLTLDVTPPCGETYRAHACWLIDIPELSSFAEGSEIQIRIDASEPNVIYPGSERAFYIPG